MPLAQLVEHSLIRKNYTRTRETQFESRTGHLPNLIPLSLTLFLVNLLSTIKLRQKAKKKKKYTHAY